jgi:U3 small nucleolar RNA-associated protein 18
MLFCTDRYFIQLFVIDDNGPPSSIASFIPQNNDEASDTESHASHSRSRSPSTSHSASSPPPKTQPLVSQLAAWIDADDSTLAVSLSAPRLRKLRDAPDESILGGREYERRLRRQFERINPTPAWASRRTGNTAKRMRDDGFDATDGSGEDNDEDDVEGLLKSTSGLAGKRKLRVLEKGTLSIERLRDANISAPAEGAVRCVAFHPSPDVPVLAVASADRRVRLFNVSDPLL